MPPKKKKGKKKKKIVETEEEKKARMEAEMLAAEETRKKAEQEARKRMIEKAKEEESVAKKSMALILTDVRQRLRAIKMVELIEECDITVQSYERKIDQRDAIIESLLRDMEEAERQYQIVIRSHMSNLDNLIEVQNERFHVLEQEMLEDTEEITKLHEDEKKELQQIHEKQRSELLQILQLMEERFEDQMQKDRKAFDEEKKEVEEEQRNELMANKTNLSMRVGILTTALQELHKKYISNTEKQTQEFRLYAKKEQIDAHEIAQLIHQIRRNQEQFQRVKKKIQNTVKEYEEKNAALGKEKDTITKHYRNLKRKMAIFRTNQQKRLRELTMQSRDTVNTLKEKEKLGTQIISIGELNRKMETDREKVLPFFPTLAETDEEVADALRELEEDEEKEDEQDMDVSTKEDVLKKKTPTSLSAAVPAGKGKTSTGALALPPSQQLHSQFSQLDQFYKRLNRAMLDKLAIEHEHARLERENADLREILRQYLEGVTINESVSSSANPIMVVQPVFVTNAPSRMGVGGRNMLYGEKG